MTPFVHELLQPVALLPTVKTVFYLLLFLLHVRRPVFRAARARAQFTLKRIKHLGNMIIELSAGKGVGRCLPGIRAGRFPPSKQNCFSSRHQIIAESVELIILGLEHSDNVVPQ